MNVVRVSGLDIAYRRMGSGAPIVFVHGGGDDGRVWQTLLIWGELDARSPLAVARQFARAIPHAELVVTPSCGHMSNLERPGEFNAAVREFCRANPPGQVLR